MRIKFISILIGTCITTIGMSQVKHVSMSLGIGYKSNISTIGIGLGFWYREHWELNLSSSIHFGYASSGFTSGIKYKFTPAKRFFLSAQASYRYLFASKSLSIGYDNDRHQVTYAVAQSNSIVPQLGINYRLDGEAGGKGNVISFNLNYLTPLNSVTATYVKGDMFAEIEKSINERYHQGLGFSIVFMGYF